MTSNPSLTPTESPVPGAPKNGGGGNNGNGNIWLVAGATAGSALCCLGTLFALALLRIRKKEQRQNNQVYEVGEESLSYSYYDHQTNIDNRYTFGGEGELNTGLVVND